MPQLQQQLVCANLCSKNTYVTVVMDGKSTEINRTKQHITYKPSIRQHRNTQDIQYAIDHVIDLIHTQIFNLQEFNAALLLNH